MAIAANGGKKLCPLHYVQGREEIELSEAYLQLAVILEITLLSITPITAAWISDGMMGPNRGNSWV